ncbi:MAG: hypothetical protein M0Q53_09355 [Prolixibacteraceae bacterium]|jgi:hypothetical protein|nr:hypothetical protein [Prolixibacteraceae bacterium]
MKKSKLVIYMASFLMLALFNSCNEKLKDGGLRIGWAIEDITPDGPASLYGQYYERISTYVQSPLKVTACAIESSDENGNKEQAIMVSLDLAQFGKSLQDTLRLVVKQQIPDFNVGKLFLNATHTHSAPNPNAAGKYRKLLLERAGKAIIAAWNNRKPAGISRGLGYAVVGHNRRVEYANGKTEMYGRTDREDFIGIEGPTNPGVDMLFCWDLKKNLTGIIMNVSCPSQVTEAKYYVSSDYWSEVRKQMKDRFSENVFVLPQCGAAGDISPRDLPRGYKSLEANMWEVPGIIEIGRRLRLVIDEAYPDARNTIQTSVVFKHSVKDINLPTRRVSKEEYDNAQKMVNEIRSREPEDKNSPNTAWNRFLQEMKDNEKVHEHGPWDSKTSDYGWLKPMEAVLRQYQKQDKDTVFKMELHAIRLNDVAIATNPFELYTDYGFRITGRCKAKQTFIVQLSGDTGGYLPIKRALQGGGYSAMANHIGPTGGDMLVDETVKMIDAMWK